MQVGVLSVIRQGYDSDTICKQQVIVTLMTNFRRLALKLGFKRRLLSADSYDTNLSKCFHSRGHVWKKWIVPVTIHDINQTPVPSSIVWLDMYDGTCYGICVFTCCLLCSAQRVRIFPHLELTIYTRLRIGNFSIDRMATWQFGFPADIDAPSDIFPSHVELFRVFGFQKDDKIPATFRDWMSIFGALHARAS